MAVPYVRNNRITDNHVTGNITAAGGGVYGGVVSNNEIIGNTVSSTIKSYGAGVYGGIVSNNLIANNTASGASYGGGVMPWSTSLVVNNTIIGNTAQTGGGVCTYFGSSYPESYHYIANNIIVSNSSGIANYNTNYNCQPIIQNNCVYSNSGSDYVGVAAGPGDISVDPQFVSGTYQLSASSLCIDKGEDWFIEASDIDILGKARTYGSYPDMGAYEYHPSYNVIHVSTNGNDSNDGLSWATAKATVQAGIDAASSGDEVWVAAGTYTENLSLDSGVALYGGFTGDETARVQRNFKTNITTLDGGGAASVVLVADHATALTRIDGFTITNGNGSGFLGGCGGAIAIYDYANPVIANNRIVDNYAFASGGAIAGGWAAQAYITRNTIENNSAHTSGAIAIEGGKITFNLIKNNEAFSTFGDDHGEIIEIPGEAGGISIGSSGTSNALVLNNVFEGNTSTGIAGAVCHNYGDVTFANNVFNGNSAADGGAFYLHYPAKSKIINNTIVNNVASNEGGAVYSCGTTGCPKTFANNIIAFNSSGLFADGNYGTTLSHNDVYGNTGYNYSGIAAGTGDISADPKFMDAANGDFHLDIWSPCIARGDQSQIDMTWVDMDKHQRSLNFGFSNPDHIDMGADEVGAHY